VVCARWFTEDTIPALREAIQEAATCHDGSGSTSKTHGVSEAMNGESLWDKLTIGRYITNCTFSTWVCLKMVHEPAICSYLIGE